MIGSFLKQKPVIGAGNPMSSPPVEAAGHFYTFFYAAASAGVTRRGGYFP
jgi:hypothetical protein